MALFRKAYYHGLYFAAWVLWAVKRCLNILSPKNRTGMKRKVAGHPEPTHILFCMVDHYEPGTGDVPPHIEKERIDTLVSKFSRLSDRHRDFFDNPLKRTWFFPPHYHREGTLKRLTSLCKSGCGEIELHLHHGYVRPDTSENLERTLRQCIKEYSIFGIFGTENGQKRYGFIHGDSALDNSRNGKYCGVNDEIRILAKTGCYADFSFPTLDESNPIQINSIFYARDNVDRPKSYNTGSPVKRLTQKCGDLMIIEGPIHPWFFAYKKVPCVKMFGDEINGKHRVSAKRIDCWVKTGIHVRGREDWIIIKTHTHGAVDSAAVLGEEMDEICSYLETKYNDGTKYVLHYTTARELYNIICAAEAGEPGTNPEQYRDYRIQPPQYDDSPEVSGASEELQSLVARTCRR